MFMDFMNFILPAIFGFIFNEAIREKKLLFGILCLVIIGINLFIKYCPEIVIDVSPREAEIYIDGSHVGTGKKAHRTSLGSHRMRLCLRNDPFFHESSEIVQTNYFEEKLIKKELKPKIGRLFVDIQTCMNSNESKIHVQSVQILGDRHWDTKSEHPFFFAGVPAGIYIVHVDYLKNGKSQRETIEQVYVIDEKMGGKVKIAL